jgi:8-oxo-dGTP pyrophosphatase MutT (NUDIX family)
MPGKPPLKKVKERSAGVVIYHDAGPVDAPQRRFLLLDYGRYWDFAKGHVEAGEDDLAAARREVREETGLTEVELDPGFCREITYHFRKPGNRLVHKTVAFFIGRSVTDSVTISHEHVGYAWKPYDEALAAVAHQNAKAVLSAAAAHLAGKASG